MFSFISHAAGSASNTSSSSERVSSSADAAELDTGASSSATATAAATASSKLVVDLSIEKERISATSKTSWIWDYFSSKVGKEYPVCKLCDQMINYGASKSTSKLTNHVFHKHRGNYDAYMELEAGKKRKLSGNILNFVVSGGDYMKEYLRWIIETFQPISTCDNPFFRRMLNAYSSKRHSDICAGTVTTTPDILTRLLGRSRKTRGTIDL
jgi:hypothetical protein